MRKNKQLVGILLGGVSLFILLLYTTTFIQPKIIFKTEVSTVNDEDYSRIIGNNQVKSENKEIERFKHISVEINVKTPFGLIKNVHIDRVMLEEYLRDNNSVQILSGGSYQHGNQREYAEEIGIYLNDITEDELRNILSDFKYKVKWTNMWNESNEEIYYFNDYEK